MSDLTDFLQSLFGEHEGYVYAPIKTTKGSFEPNWFSWPDEKYSLETHLEFVEDGDLYLAPVLFNSTSTQDFKLSNVCWADFDHGVPKEMGDFPEPAFVIASSASPSKRHVYWKLSGPVLNSDHLELWNKQLAYAFNADRCCWNFSRVLRPPGTLNHKYSPPEHVVIKDSSAETIDPFVFAMLPDPPANVDKDDWDLDVGKLRSVRDLNRKYEWSPAAWDFFTQGEPDRRANSLSSIAMTCIEMGMERDEIFVYLSDAAERWDKFTGRRDRTKRLKDIVTYAEAQVVPPKAPATEKDLSRPLSWRNFAAHRFNIDWVVDGLIHSKGMALIASPPGIGKTQVSLNFAMCVGTGRDFLGWKIDKPRRILFLSLEMSQPELKEYMDTMQEGFTEAEKDLLDENVFFQYAPAFRLGSENNQRKLLDWIDEIKPDGIIIDSLSRCVGGDLEKGEIDIVFDFLNSEVRDKRNCFLWFVHHNRKANFNQKQPKKLEDVYGSQYIGAYASTVLGLWSINNDELEVNCLKLWLRPKFKSFFIRRDANLVFSRTHAGVTELV